MGIFKCLSACLLVSAALLLNLPPGLCGCYKRIFSFGDSIIDTGNFIHMSGNGSSRYKELPYGMTFFKNAIGRICDGHVLVDFYAQAFQLPMIPPNLPEQDSGLFPNGANFAVAGATAMPPAYYYMWNHSVPMPHSLGVQIGWFKEMLQHLAPGDDDGAKIRQLLNESLIVLGEIGGNDYNFWFWFGDATKPREQASRFIPDIVAYIGSSVQELIGLGATSILIPSNFPIGCVSSYLSMFPSSDPTDFDGDRCLRWFNDFSTRHNKALRGEVARLKARNPGAKLIYADYYGAAMEFVKNPGRFGIGNPLVACCGGGGPYHTGAACERTAKVWGNPSYFANWDGVHMTEMAYEVIAQGVFNGPLADPPLLSC
ncbi:hypothetical protein PVAP13_5NG405500 [Panicum virgatum]|uniref:GDSL esterase/lipase n=1 Tax=Panicum virgatum TaxID=38727 RepID=A0A8T0RYC7_PANVG|nr:hypothetical protein PVAP13_5NG405500 [Panicum virgatum]